MKAAMICYRLSIVYMSAHFQEGYFSLFSYLQTFVNALLYHR